MAENLVRAEAALFLQNERFPQTEGAHWQVHLQKVVILDLYRRLGCLPENPVRRLRTRKTSLTRGCTEQCTLTSLKTMAKLPSMREMK